MTLEEMCKNKFRELVENGENHSMTEEIPSLLTVKTANECISDAMKVSLPQQLWSSLWYEGELCCLFADSNVGKSIYAVQMANEIAKTHSVIYFDFELSEKQFQMRYTDDNGVGYVFPDNLHRAEVNPDNISSENFEEDILNAIIDAMEKYSANVLIIDNITFLNALTEHADAASRLMIALCQIKRNYGVSILILAHTPKRLLSSPITQNDLAGSKRLFNFFDSVFAIGKSAMGEDIRYIKQLKSRSSSIDYGANSVITAQIVKEGAYLCLSHQDMTTESAHLSEKKSENDDLKEEALRLVDEEHLTMRQVAEKLGVSKSTVGRWVNN